MKQIKFSDISFKEKTIQFYNNMAIIVGDNGSGKTTLLNSLEKGFKGKNSNFTVDNELVSFDSYQIIYLKEYFSLKENLKLTKTSSFRNDLIQNINQSLISTNNFKYKSLLTDLEKLESDFFELLNDSYFKSYDNNIKNHLYLKPMIESFSINNMVDKMLKIQIFDEKNDDMIDEENYSHFFLRILLFNILNNALRQKDKLRPTVILFDLPELYGTPKLLFQINKFLKEIIKENNVIVIIATNSPLYLSLLKPNLLSFNFLKNKEIFFIKNLAKIIRESIICFSFLESDIKELNVYKNNLDPLISQEDIDNECNYINNYLYEKLINSFFSNKIELWFKNLICNSNEEEYVIQHQGSFKDLLFINNLLFEGFNIICEWKNSDQIPNFIKLDPYLNN